MVGKIIYFIRNKKVMRSSKTPKSTSNNVEIVSYSYSWWTNKEIFIVKEYTIKDKQFRSSFINKDLKIKLTYITTGLNFIIKNQLSPKGQQHRYKVKMLTVKPTHYRPIFQSLSH